MAEEFLVTRELTGEKIIQGARVLVQLDNDGFPVRAAYWRFDYDARVWLLYIVSPVMREPGWHGSYASMAAVMQRLQIDVLDYRLIDERDTVYRDLHRRLTFFLKDRVSEPRTWLPSGMKMNEDLHVYRI